MLVLVGCSDATESASFEHVFDACAPLALAPVNATDAERASIGDAGGLWSDVGITGPLEGGAVDSVGIAFGAAAPGVYGFYDDAAATIHVSDALSTDQTSIVIAHELGHAFGLVHVTDRASVMNAGNLTVVPTDDDRAAVAALWGDCAVR